jgi:hypothetical protein
MEKPIRELLFHNFSRKLFAILAAFCIWLYVNTTITETKTFFKIPVRVVNIPSDKTIRGLMPNNILDRRISITLTGQKELLERLDRKDFEIVIDASSRGDEWIVRLDKKNLVSHNPDIDFLHNISKIDYPEFVVRFSKLVSGKVPVYFRASRGEPPEGYQFLDIFPQRIVQTISGPEEDVRKLVEDGLELTFDLSLISKEELDALQSSEQGVSDEVSFPIPDSWKRVAVPFQNGMRQELNSPEAKNLRIDFLRKDILPIDRDVLIRVFYPVAIADHVNPTTCPLKPCPWIINKNDLSMVHRKLYVSDVSRLFLDIVRDKIEIVIISDPNQGNQLLRWQVQFIDPRQLEDRYVSLLLDTGKDSESLANQNSNSMLSQKLHLALRERFLRSRFRDYMQRFGLYEQKGVPFVFRARQEKDGIVVSD